MHLCGGFNVVALASNILSTTEIFICHGLRSKGGEIVCWPHRGLYEFMGTITHVRTADLFCFKTAHSFEIAWSVVTMGKYDGSFLVYQLPERCITPWEISWRAVYCDFNPRTENARICFLFPFLKGLRILYMSSMYFYTSLSWSLKIHQALS